MKCRSRPFLAAATAAALPIALLCAAALVSHFRSASAATEDAAARPNITISNYGFHPAVLTIAKGATVLWINKDEDVHTIRSKDGPEGFNSPALQTGSRFGFRFDRAGTYRYICSVHPYMHGVIVVR